MIHTRLFLDTMLYAMRPYSTVMLGLEAKLADKGLLIALKQNLPYRFHEQNLTRQAFATSFKQPDNDLRLRNVIWDRILDAKRTLGNTKQDEDPRIR